MLRIQMTLALSLAIVGVLLCVEAQCQTKIESVEQWIKVPAADRPAFSEQALSLIHI